MKKERLLRLEQELRKPELPAGIMIFDMGMWWSDTPECGTAACAMGIATTIPEFQEAGLTLVDYPDNGLLQRRLKRPRFYEFTDWAAAAHLFEIEYDQAEYLFGVTSYSLIEEATTREQVADRIKAFVETDGELI